MELRVKRIEEGGGDEREDWSELMGRGRKKETSLSWRGGGAHRTSMLTGAYPIQFTARHALDIGQYEHTAYDHRWHREIIYMCLISSSSRRTRPSLRLVLALPTRQHLCLLRLDELQPWPRHFFLEFPLPLVAF